MTLPYQGNWPGHSLKRTVSIIMSTAEAFILLVNYVTLEPYLRQSSWGRQHWILNRCLPVLRELKVYQKTCSGDIWTTLLTAGFRLKGVYYPEGIGQLSLIWLVLCCVLQPAAGLKETLICLQMYHKLRGRDGRFEPLSDFAVAQAADVSSGCIRFRGMVHEQIDRQPDRQADRNRMRGTEIVSCKDIIKNCIMYTQTLQTYIMSTAAKRLLNSIDFTLNQRHTDA